MEPKAVDTNPNLISADNTADLDRVTDLDVFTTGVVNWHTNIINQAVHAMAMPEPREGDEAYINVLVTCDPDHPDYDPETGKRPLMPEELSAFKAGIRYMHDMVINLPFKFVPTDADGMVVPEYQTEDQPDVEGTDSP